MNDDEKLDLTNIEIRTIDLVKDYGRFRALDHVSLEVRKGEIFGLLGLNGAGKSTFIKILTTITAPSSGKAFVGGLDVSKHSKQARKLIGYVPQYTSVDAWLTGEQVLKMLGSFYGIPKTELQSRIDEIFSLIGLEEWKDKLTRFYSGGMKRRLDLASGLLHKPRVLILDEPTLGVDPDLRIKLWDLIRDIREMGTTVLIATHYLDEADILCDRVGILHKGKLIAVDSPMKLKEQFGDSTNRLDIAFLKLTQSEGSLADMQSILATHVGI